MLWSFKVEGNNNSGGFFAHLFRPAAAQLRNICATFYRELTPALRVSARAADSIQADCVLYSLLAARHDDGAAANDWAQPHAIEWMDLLGLRGRTGYLTCRRADLPVNAVD
ncbi:siderophore ferric iron reductase, partial [Achromobacter xylosoxidans]